MALRARERETRIHAHELRRFAARIACGRAARAHAPDANAALSQRRLPYERDVAMARDGALAVHALEEYALRWHGATPTHRVVEDDACERCGGAVALVDPFCMEVCESCGATRQRHDATVASSTHAAGDAPRLDFRVFVYSRSSYAEHLLRTLQARSNSAIPDSVLADVGAEVRLGKKSGPSVRDVELAMRRLTRARNAARRRGRDDGPSMQPYYESAALVRAKLVGQQPFRLTRAMEGAVLHRFREASRIFDGLGRDQALSHRKNFVSYAYTLRRIVNHLEKDFPGIGRFNVDILPHEGRDRRLVNATIWKTICQTAGWPDNSGPI